MKKTLLSLFLLCGVLATAQEVENSSEVTDISNNYDHWSIELSGGAVKADRPFADNYYVNTPSSYQASLAVRYMLNPKFGLKLDGGYTSLDGDKNSLDFKTTRYHASLQGVMNLTNVLNFGEWSKTVGLLFHAGAGYGRNNYKTAGLSDDAKNDDMTTWTAGITPMFRISNSIALTLDVSAYGNIRQTRTWDGTQYNPLRGFDGSLYTFSAGINFYLGGAEKHADWYSEDSFVKEKLSDLEARLAKVETDMIDTDQDGVADYLDQEPNTLPNVTVNTKGITVDKNNNGIPDEMESGLDSRYSSSTKTASNFGVRELLDKGYVNVYFEFNSSKPETYSLEAINYLIKYMAANPSSKASLLGYADEIGGEGYNNTLSEKRAKKVYDILIASGVTAERLSYKGGGEDSSVDKTSSPARQLVRRVTFKINE